MPDKAAIRHGLLVKRDALSPEDRREKSSAVARRLFDQPEYKKALSVLFYVSFRSEVATRGMIEAALAAGKKVLVPKVDRKAHRLKVYEITDPAADLGAGYMGIYEPVEGVARHAGPEEADLVVLPGVGFDKKGWRIGYGGGYYDRLLDSLKPDTALVALAFDVQVADEIPHEGHDKRVDKVVTETRVIGA